MPHDIFISYSSQNKEAADAICHLLEEKGIRCWIAPRDIPGGSQYGDVIDNAIKSCRIVIVVFSEPAAASPWVNGELNVAFEEQKTIIPFRIDQTPLSGQTRVMLNQKHWIDAYPDYKTKFDDLIDAVMLALGHPNSQQPLQQYPKSTTKHVMTNPANIPMLQISVPEAIVCSNEIHIGYDPTYTCTCTAIGPGIGTDINTFGLLKSKIESAKSAMVIDADAITLIGRDKSLLSILPHESILTPHHAELKRLIGKTANKYDELEKTRLLCMKYHLNIVIKWAYSAVVNSDGTVYFNTTGNPGMATAGSGDVLTGLILALLAQGYEPKNALRLSVFLHGLAGDIAAEEHTIFGITAGDIADNIGRAYKRLLTV